MKRALLASTLERVTTKPWRRVESMPDEERWRSYFLAAVGSVLFAGGLLAVLAVLGVGR